MSKNNMFGKILVIPMFIGIFIIVSRAFEKFQHTISILQPDDSTVDGSEPDNQFF